MNAASLVRELPGRAALLLIALTVSLPFLHPHHRLPIQSFFPEWWAATGGVLASLALLAPRYRAAAAPPKIAWLPLALATLILLQAALISNALPDVALLAALYLLWATLLMVLAASLIAVHGAPAFALAIAGGLAFGALASALVVALQASAALRGTGWISAPIGGRLFGNLNQPNHLALQLWLGIAALLYLRERRRLALPLLLPALACLVGASLLAGSRAVLLYAVALPALALWSDRRADPDAPRRWPLAAAALAMALAGQFILSQTGGQVDATTLGARTWGEHSDTMRGGLWWMAWQMGIDHPLTGIGWGRFTSQSFSQITAYRAAAPAAVDLVPAEHAHNLLLHLFAELGTAAPLLVVGLGFALLVRFVRRKLDAEGVLAAGLLLPIALHAQLEYTLWYSFFLGVAAFALALADPARLNWPRPKASLLGLILGAALATLALLRVDYSRLENAMQWPLSVDGAPPRSWAEVRAELIDLRRHSRFGRYVDLAFAGAMSLGRDGLADKLTVCETAIAFSPTDYAVFKCAGLLALEGRAAAARDRLRRALLAYPHKAPEFIARAGELLAAYPELSPLLDEARAFVAARQRPVI